MPLSEGHRLGHYEIVSLLGAGGQGEVYRARDTRLDRTVAVKILPPRSTSDEHFRERLAREAKVVSRLSHPNVCVLLDVGQDGEVAYLVMEYLEGETLADRLRRGRLPPAEALEAAIAVASALSAAHRAGIVHRDLKPGNVMLTASGVKLLDFGLAKLQALPAPLGSNVPTTPKPLTQEGTVLGTFQYMAPEQLRGREADARSDLFAFGAVLYEMLAGRPAFESDSQAGLIVAILEHHPAPVLDETPSSWPGLERLVMKCLAKDPDSRWQTATDLLDELRWIANPDRAPSAARTTRANYGTWLGLGVAALLAAIGIALFPRADGPTTVYLDIAPSAEAAPFQPTTMALSPDGRFLAWVGGDDRSIWLRAMTERRERRLEGTEQADGLFWSPDGTAIGFFSHDALKTTPVSGGSPQRICDAPVRTARSGAWSGEAVILFGAAGNPIHRVNASGGAPEAVTTLSPPEQTIHRRPYFLPDDRHFLFLGGNRQTGQDAIFVGDLGSPAVERIVASDYMATYVKPGYLLFAREGSLFAQTFDAERFELKGEPVRVADQLDLNQVHSLASFATSDTGVLIYRREGASRINELRWFDRAGRPLGSVGEAGLYRNPNLSPQGELVLFDRPDLSDIWLADADRGVSARFTFEPGLELAPHWSGSGDQVLYISNEAGSFDLYLKPAKESGAATKLIESSFDIGLTDWSRDGRYAVFIRFSGFKRDLWAVPMSGDKDPFPLVESEFDESQGQVSPDGGWIAYASNESGPYEIYAQRFPETGNKVRLSTAGGVQPRWSSDGSELFYISPDLKLMSVTLAPSGGSLNPGAPQVLFQTRIWGGASTEVGHRAQYAVAPAGDRFLVNTSAADATPFTVVLNWTAALER